MNDPSRNGHAQSELPEGEAPEAAANPLLLVHRLLRGRYLLAAALGLTLAAPAAIMGFKALPETYTSSAIVQVNPTIPHMLYQLEEYEIPAAFDSFVATQARYLTSQRVIRLASENPRLRDAGWPTGNTGVLALERTVRVIHWRRETSITLESSHTDPRMAQLAVNSVLDAYVELHGEQLGLRISERQANLTDLVQRLTRDLNSTRESVFQLSDEYGVDTLPNRHQSRLAQLEEYDASIARLEIALANAEARAAGVEGEGVEVPPLAIEELAQRDPMLQQMMEMRAEMEIRYASMSQNFGPNHRDMRELSRQMAELEDRIKHRAEVAARNFDTAGSADGASALAGVAIEELRARLDQYRQIRTRTSEEVRELGRRIRLIESLKERASETKVRLDQASKDLEDLRLETQVSRDRPGRVVIAQRGEVPLAPSRDKRKQLAAVGAMGGMGLGVGLIALYGFLRPTFRYIDEVEDSSGSTTLLGTLPDFSHGKEEERDLAALSVHHLRSALQSVMGHGRSKVLVITSPASGDGKTSLVMALGTSFAATGQKTVLVDTDLVGRGLTRELKLTREEGLPEALHRGVGEGLVQETSVPSLSILGAGRHGALDPTKLSRDRLEQVVAELRERYAVILVDTGPLMGSLEANMVAPMADHVVVAVSRGQNAKLVRATMERLRRIGGRCAGIVFNRAAPMDFKQSVSHASIHSQSIPHRVGEEGKRRPATRASLMDAVAGVEAHEVAEEKP